MKKILLIIIMFLLTLSFAGCSKTKTGNFNLYYDDEFIGNTHKIIIKDDLICIINPIESDDWYQYNCWDKDKIDYIEVKED